MSTLATVIQHSFGSPRHRNQTKKRNKVIQIGKEEVKLPFFTDDIILYVENPKDSIKIALELIHKFSKFSEYKFNAQKSVTFLHSNNETTEREVKDLIPLRIASKGRLGGSVG